MRLERQTARTDVLLLEFASQVALRDEQDQQTIFFDQKRSWADLDESRFSSAAIADCRE